MADVSLDKLVPISEVRAKISSLVKGLGEENYFVITKTGSPAAALVSLPLLEGALGEVALKKSEKDLFLKAAGRWKEVDSEKMIKRIYKGRRDKSSSKKFLAKTR